MRKRVQMLARHSLLPPAAGRPMFGQQSLPMRHHCIIQCHLEAWYTLRGPSWCRQQSAQLPSQGSEAETNAASHMSKSAARANNEYNESIATAARQVSSKHQNGIRSWTGQPGIHKRPSLRTSKFHGWQRYPIAEGAPADA